MKIKVTIITIIICLAYLQARSQQIWSLEQCIEYALKNNIQVKQQQLNLEIAKEDLLQSKINLLPDLNANATHVYNFGQTIDLYTNTFATERVQSNNFAISSNLVLFSGLQQFNNIKRNKLLLNASNFDLQKMKDDIALQIATAYLGILFNMELLDIAQKQVDITKQQVDRTSKMVEAGTVARGNQLTIEAQLASEEMQVVDAQNQLDLSILLLTQLLDLPSPKGFMIEKPQINIAQEVLSTQTPESIYNSALVNRPEIKSAELNLKSSKINIAIAKGAISPTIAISGSYGTGYSEASKRLKEVQPTGTNDTLAYINVLGVDYPVTTPHYNTTYEKTPFSTQINNNQNKSVGLYLSVPIFNRFQTKSRIAKAKIAYKNAEYMLDYQKNQLNKTIQQAYSDATASLKRYTAADKSVIAYQESFNYAEQRYNVGMLNPVDYNDAKNKLLKSQSDLLQAKYNYVFRKKILDFYLGKPLTLVKGE